MPLRWGHGPRHLELFLEPTCPFSRRAFGKLDELMQLAGPQRLTLSVHLLSQPWHTFSPVVTRAVLAAASLPGGRTAAVAVLAAVFSHREQFVLEQHASGPNLDCSPRQLLELIGRLSGVDVLAAYQQPELEASLKWQARYARQNGIHVTPSFMIDGLLVPDMGSGEPVAQWLGRLGLA